MSKPERQQNVLELLEKLAERQTGIEPLRTLFWTELNYQRVNEPLSRRGWTESASKSLADDPVLFAGGGENNDFHVIYGRLASDRLLLGNERPVVSRLVKEHPYALFVFSNKAQDRWHFLNVKYDDTAEKRRLFRRITVGPEERLRTASERISLLSLDAISPELFGVSPLMIQQHHDEAFDVEAVTKQFFADFCDMFMRVAKDIKDRNRSLDEEAVEQETQTLLNRLLFLYFVQRKGWLNRQRDYLYENFRAHYSKDSDGTTYYSQFLQRLFIKLSTEGEHLESLGDVPFLNGGLFDDEMGQQSTETLRRTRMKVGNAVFRRLFDDLLERYNFTVREDTPLDQDVAIDPEMLGKIFESLVLQLEQSDTGGKTSRHDTGSYYTPRPIVHYLCREGLRAWLEQSPPIAKRAEDWPKRLEKLLTLDASDGIQPEEHAILDECLTTDEAQALLDRLDDFRACDPAVGSGAFPVGLLHEIVNLRRLCETRARGKDPVAGDSEWLFNTKSAVIQRVLYGVDIQERAIEICKLRLWLSLMVDHPLEADVDNCSETAFRKALKNLPALPNLDYKIRRANSLIDQVRGHPVNLDRIPAEDKSLPPILNKLTSAKRAFYDAHKAADKRRAKFDILDATAELGLLEFKRSKLEVKDALVPDENSVARLRELDAAITELLALQSQIRGARKKSAGQQDEELERLGEKFDDPGKPTFVWRLDFAEVFHRKGAAGFDLIIANPPYVSNDTMPDDEKAAYQRLYLTGKKFDLYQCFIEGGVKLLKTGGSLAMILPNTFLTGKSFAKLRTFLLDHTSIGQIVDMPQGVFESVIVDNVLFFTSRMPPNGSAVHINLLREKSDPARVTSRNWDDTYAIKQSDFKQSELKSINLALTPPVRKVFAKLETKSKLGDLFDVCDGLIPYKTAEDAKASRYTDTIHHSGWGKLLRGKGISRYAIHWQGEYIKYGGHLWCKRDERFFKNPKILLHSIRNKSLPRRLVGALDNEKYYNTDNLINVIAKGSDSNLALLLGLLNSTLINFWYKLNYPNVNINPNELRTVPLPDRETGETDEIVFLVEKILAAKQPSRGATAGQGGAAAAEVSAWEREIDERVYRLYGLTKDEIKLVESASAKATADKESGA